MFSLLRSLANAVLLLANSSSLSEQDARAAVSMGQRVLDHLEAHRVAAKAGEAEAVCRKG